MIRRSVIAGCGSFLPGPLVPNAALESRVETSDAWIRERTGIQGRHLVADGETTADLAIQAARAALVRAGVEARDVQGVVLATTTPAETMPATATRVQGALGITQGFAFDVQAACSGFLYALTMADNAIRLGQAETILVIGAESFSRLLDWTDRTTCVLFGDGAGAVVLKAAPGTGSIQDRGILDTRLHADGRLYDILKTDGGAGSTATTGKVRMRGREVFRHAVEKLTEVVEETLTANGLTPQDLDWFVPHQANQRIIEATAKKLGLGPERVVLTVAEHANTSGASIPLALAAAEADGRLQPGQLVLLDALGAGLTWASALVRW